MMNKVQSGSKHIPWIVLIFLLGLAFRLIHFIQFQEFPLLERHGLLIDSEFYDLWARHLAAGNWMGEEAFFMGPLYPYALAVVYWVFGSDFIWIRILQTLLGSLTCLGVYFLGKQIFSRAMGLWAAVFITLYSPFYFYEHLLLATSLLIFLSLACSLVLVAAFQSNRSGHWFFAGLLLGLTAVGKANTLLALPLIACWILARNSSAVLRGGLPKAAWFLVGAFLLIAPITIRNALVQKDFVLLTANGGLNLFVGNNPESEGVWKRFELPYPGANIDHHIAALKTGRKAYQDLKPSEIDRLLTRRVFDFIQEEPGRFLKLLGKKFLIAMNAYEVGNRDDIEFGRRFSGFLRLPLLNFGLIAPLGILGFLISLAALRRNFAPILFTAVPIFTLVMIFVLARYRLVAMPFLCLFAAKAVSDLLSVFRAKRFGKAALLCLALAALIALVHIPFERLEVKGWQGAANTAYAGFLLEKDRPGPALDELKIALDQNPDDAIALNLKAVACMKMGRHQAALNAYRHAWETYPEDLDWALRVSKTLTAMGRFGDAEDTLREALEKAPNNTDLLKGLASLLVKMQGRGDEAVNLAKQVLSINPTPLSQAFLGWIQFRAGRVEQGRRLLEAVQAKNPENEQVKAWLNAVKSGRLENDPKH